MKEKGFSRNLYFMCVKNANLVKSSNLWFERSGNWNKDVEAGTLTFNKIFTKLNV